MLKKILLLVLLSATFMFGSDWWIYTYEDVSTLKAVFNYLAMVKSDSGYMKIINTVLIAGLTFTIIFKFLDIMAIPKYLLSVIGTMLIVFSTDSTVMISNVKSYDSANPHSNNYATVDNVPFIFAALSSAFSSVGYNSALLIETIFSTVTTGSDISQASFLKTGNLGAWKVLDALDSIDALAISSDGQDFNKNFNEYLQLCVFKIGYAIDPGLKSQVEQRSDILEYLNPASSPNSYVQTLSTQKVIDSEGTLTTCNSLYTKAYTSFSNLSASGVAYNKAQSLVSKITSNVDGATSTVAKMMTGSSLTSAQANINNYILMSGVRKAFESSWQSYGIGASSAQAGFGAGLAEANLQAQGKVKAKSAATMMPSIHSVLQAVMYVLFPLVLIVQLFAGGFKILQNYILGILWLELWIPSYSVLNFFTLKEAQEQAYDKLVNTTTSSGPEGMLTLANQNEIYNTIANQAAIAADMYIVGIPALAGFILFASFQALSGITSGVAGVVGQYANNQTLNQERANLAALDNINEQMKLNNPLYTGNVGTVQAMMAQDNSISQASKAAGNFLASGSSLESFNNLSKANMFSAREQTTASVNRESLLKGDTGTASELSSIKAGEDKIAGTNLNKQASAVGLNEGSLFNNAQNMKNFETNIVSGATDDGVKTEKLVGGGSSTTLYTPIGKTQQTLDNSGNVVQSSTDASFSKDTSNTVKDNNIYEAKTVNDTSTMKNSSNTNNADNTSSAVNTATYTTDDAEKIEAITGEDGKFLSTKVTQTTQDGVIEKYFDKDGNLAKSKLDGSDIINMDEKYSGMKTNEYTDNNGLVYKEYLDGSGNAVGRTVTEYSSSGYYVKDQRLSENGEWEDIRKSMDGSNKTDLSTQEDYSKIYKNNNTHEEMTTKDTSITLKDNFTLEAKNTWDAFNINQRINGVDAMDSFRQTMDNISAGATVKNWASNPIGAATDIYSMVKASATNSNLQDGADRVNFEPDKNTYLKDRTDSFFSFGNDTKNRNDTANDVNSKENK